MILYEYRCADCGDFSDWNAMARAGEPAHLPRLRPAGTAGCCRHRTCAI